AGRTSLAYRVVFVDERGLLVAVDRDDDREADRRLGRGDADDHQGDDRALDGETGHERPERDDRQVGGVEHQLDRHEHADRVAAREEPEHADREQEAREDEVGVQRARSSGRQGDQPEPDNHTRGHHRPEDDPDHSADSSSLADRSRFARKTAPITAASRRTPTTSNGRTQSRKSGLASSPVSVTTRSAVACQSVEPMARTMMTTRITAAIEAGTARVWKHD